MISHSDRPRRILPANDNVSGCMIQFIKTREFQGKIKPYLI